MDSFNEQTCDFSMNSYGISPDSCTSIVFPDHHKSKCQKKLELKRMLCARQQAKKRCIPREKLMTHAQWIEKENKCKQQEQKCQEEMLRCAKKFQELSLKKNYKKCPFMNKLQTILESSDDDEDEVTEGSLMECASGFDQLMLHWDLHLHVFDEMEEETEEEAEEAVEDENEYDVIQQQEVDRLQHDATDQATRQHIKDPASTSSSTLHNQTKPRLSLALTSSPSTSPASSPATSPRILPLNSLHNSPRDSPRSPAASPRNSPSSSPRLEHGAEHKKKHHPPPRGFRKLWKQFHAMCEQSTPNPLRACETVLNYSPGATPSDLPVLM